MNSHNLIYNNSSLVYSNRYSYPSIQKMITNGYEFILNTWVHIFVDINIGTKSTSIREYTKKVPILWRVHLFLNPKNGRQRVHLSVDTKNELKRGNKEKK